MKLRKRGDISNIAVRAIRTPTVAPVEPYLTASNMSGVSRMNLTQAENVP